MRIISPDSECVAHLTYDFDATAGQTAPIWGTDTRPISERGIDIGSPLAFQIKLPADTTWRPASVSYKAGVLANVSGTYLPDQLYVLKNLRAGGLSVQIDSMATRVEHVRGNKSRTTATVTLRDDLDNPVVDAHVTGTFDGGLTESVTGTTDSTGSVTFTSTRTVKGSPEFSFCLDEITHDHLAYDETGSADCISKKGAVTGNSGNGSSREIPAKFELYGNYPNPFNPRTSVDFSLPQRATVSVRIFNTLGRKIMTISRNMEPGRKTLRVNASGLPSGVYIYQLTAAMADKTVHGSGRMILSK